MRSDKQRNFREGTKELFDDYRREKAAGGSVPVKPGRG